MKTPSRAHPHVTPAWAMHESAVTDWTCRMTAVSREKVSGNSVGTAHVKKVTTTLRREQTMRCARKSRAASRSLPSLMARGSRLWIAIESGKAKKLIHHQV